MNYQVFFIIAMAVLSAGLFLAVLSALVRGRKVRVITPFHLFFGGVFLSVLIALMPVYYDITVREGNSPLRVFFFALFSTIQIFAIDGNRELVTDGIPCQEGWIPGAYSVYLSVIYVVAPILTFVFLLSFFRNATAFLRYVNRYFHDVYIFSELSEKTVALGTDIRRKNKKAMIVFTGLHVDDDEEQTKFLEDAKDIRAICFKKDISAINFRRHSKKSGICFFSMDDDESTNIKQALFIISAYKNMENIRLYVFATGVESELLLAHTDTGNMKVRRVNGVRSLVNQNLYTEGSVIFDTAGESDENGIRNIGAVIIGLGQHGTEMLKALSWYCQMDGYRVTIDAFDMDAMAEDRFYAMVPELMSEQYNGVFLPGEAEYTIHIHTCYDVYGRAFSEEIAKLRNATYVFIALDSDETNIRTAVNLRMLFERMKIHPVIQAVVANTDEKKALEGVTNFSGQPYDIEFIGDRESSYSADVVISSELEKEALARHLKWGKEEDFWRYEYNYQSSVASAIHMKARIHCHIPGAEKDETELTEEERRGIERLEHRRWNAYMRSEGYIFSGSHDKSTRNDLAKMHHDLVEYDRMDEEEQRKDSRVGTR